jgi:hypothetical protein
MSVDVPAPPPASFTDGHNWRPSKEWIRWFELIRLRLRDDGFRSDVPWLFAHQFSGDDWGEKVVAARDALPDGWYIVDATGLTGEQDCHQNPFDGWTKPLIIVMGNSVVSTTEPWVVSGNHQGLRGIHIKSVIKYTGALTDCVLTYDASASGNGYQFTANGIRVDGNGKATDAVHFKLAKGSVLKNISATNVPGVGIRGSLCVECTFINPTVSANIANFTTMPSVGFQLDDLGISPGDFSSANTIIGITMDGIRGTLGYGIYDKSANNVYIGGGSEANKVGICFGGGASQNNSAIRLDLESNTEHDILIDNGFLNEIVSITAISSLAESIKITGGSYLNKLIGGRVNSVVIDGGCTSNAFTNIFIASVGVTPGQGWIDNGSYTSRYNIYDNAWGFYSDYSPNEIRSKTFRDDSGATQIIIKNGPSQGTTELTIWQDGAGNTQCKIDQNEFYCNVLRLAINDTSYFHFQTDGTDLFIVDSVGGTYWKYATGGDLIPLGASTQTVGDSTHRVNIMGHDADFDNAVTIGSATASKPVFTNSSKALITQDINLAGSYISCTDGTAVRTLIGAAGKASITGGSFTTVDGKTVTYNGEGVITSVV